MMIMLYYSTVLLLIRPAPNVSHVKTTYFLLLIIPGGCRNSYFAVLFIPEASKVCREKERGFASSSHPPALLSLTGTMNCNKPDATAKKMTDFFCFVPKGIGT